jgi:hypothetical protein
MESGGLARKAKRSEPDSPTEDLAGAVPSLADRLKGTHSMKLDHDTPVPSIRKGRFVVIASFACVLLTPGRADTVVLKNGDRVSGGIIKKDGPRLTIKADQFGVITASWDQVESLSADKPLNVAFKTEKPCREQFPLTMGKSRLQPRGWGSVLHRLT